MTEFATVQFRSMNVELASRLQRVIEDFGKENGAGSFDAEAMARHVAGGIEEMARDAMMFGLNFWASEQDESNQEGDRLANVVPFANALLRRSHAKRLPAPLRSHLAGI